MRNLNLQSITFLIHAMNLPGFCLCWILIRISSYVPLIIRISSYISFLWHYYFKKRTETSSLKFLYISIEYTIITYIVLHYF